MTTEHFYFNPKSKISIGIDFAKSPSDFTTIVTAKLHESGTIEILRFEHLSQGILTEVEKTEILNKLYQ